MKGTERTDVPQNNKRLESLDALRGFDMLFISGLFGLITALCSLAPGGEMNWLANQMEHVKWDGFHFCDSIFPLFIFLAGVSFPFSYSKSKSLGRSEGQIYMKAIKRALILILLGLVCNGLFNFNKYPVRMFSVLGRIGVCGLVSSVLYMNFKPSVRAVIAVVTLLGYWALNTIVAPDAPAGASSFSLEGNITAYVDRTLYPDLLYKRGLYDPEGLLSTLPAIVTAMLGNFAGEFVKGTKYSGNKKTVIMLAASAVMLGAGLLMSHWVPLNKRLWSSSYVLAVGAYSLSIFAVFYWIIDVKACRKWAFPLKVVGMNSIAIYLIPRVFSFKYCIDFFLGGAMAFMSPEWASVVYWAAYVLLGWAILYFMYRKKMFLKI